MYRGARDHLQWARTVIGGQTAPFDFNGVFQSKSVGRIMKEKHRPSAGCWFWSCYEGGARGRTEANDAAVFGVEHAYTR